MAKGKPRLSEGRPPRAQGSSPSITSPTGGYSAYDGANESSARSTLLIPTNSWQELNRFTRTQIAKKVRALEANLPILGRIKSKIAQHAVGKGIFVRPTTKDAAWNELARRFFEEWAGNPGVYSIDSSVDHYEDQLMVAESMVGDGEYLSAMVNSPAGAPMIQPLDVFECETPWGAEFTDLETYIDGVKLNEFNRPVGYAIRELPRPFTIANNWRLVPDENILHVFMRRRSKQVRGLSWFFSGINQGIDALDLRALVTGTAKLHESLGIAVNKTGKVNRKGALEKIKSVGDAKPGDEDFAALEKIYGGGLITYLGENGKIELLSSQRPSQNIREFILFLYADLALATKLPFEVVYSLGSLGGVTARGALEDAQWLFDMVMDKIICRHSFPVYRWRIAKAMKEGRLPQCKDPAWWTCSFRGPAKLTVDIGRTADANIKLINGGALSYSRYYDERSQEVRQEWTQQVDDLAWLSQYCEQKGVDINRVIVPTPGSLQIHAPEAPPN